MINLNKVQLGSPINNILVYVIYASIILMEITRNDYIRESLVSWFILRLESAYSQRKPEKLLKNL
tara:strand:- start:77 stop:271 length:195 start_codon:yes stop_codon:yes gene_type:complete